MHIVEILRNNLASGCQSIHKKRMDVLCDAVKSLLIGKKLSLVALGRELKAGAKQKHQIKRIDRLLKNNKLFDERILFYRTMTARILKKTLIHSFWLIGRTLHPVGSFTS